MRMVKKKKKKTTTERNCVQMDGEKVPLTQQDPESEIEEEKEEEEEEEGEIKLFNNEI